MHVITRRPIARARSGALTLNASSTDPLRHGLRAAYHAFGGGRFREYLTATDGTTSGAADYTGFANDLWVYFNGTAYVDTTNTLSWLTRTSPFSVALSYDTPLNNAAYAYVSTINPASNYTGWEISRLNAASSYATQIWLIDNLGAGSDLQVLYPVGTDPSRLVVTYDGTSASTSYAVYRDGVKLTQSSTSGTLAAGTCNSGQNMRIGARPDNSLPLTGYLTNILFWDRMLTPWEVWLDYKDPYRLFRPKSHASMVFMSYGASASNASTFAETGSEKALFPESASNASAFAITGSENAKFRESASNSYVLSPLVPSRLIRTGANKLQTVLKSGLSRYPNTYCETPDGPILIANGIDPMLVWDPRNRTARAAGMAAPTNAPTLGSSGSGSISGTYYGYVRWIDADGQVSNLSPISTAATVASVSTITYTHTPDNPAPLAAVRRQFLRNTDGEATTWYVDVETADLTTTGPFSSTLSDTDLSGQEAVPILDADGALFANTHDVPPSHKAVVVAHQNRIFAAAEVDYTDGHVDVTAGSTTVTGIGTAWPSNFAGRLLYVVGVAGSAEIDSVDTDAQTITLTSAWAHGTAKYNAYGIRAAPAERRLVYYSASGEPYSWPATYALSLPDDGDDITGLLVQSSYLFVLKKRRIYRFTFQADPATDGGLFLAAKRGALSNRLVVQTEDGAFMLDELGIHLYSGGDDPDPVSDPIQSIFRDADEDNALRVNWSANPLYWHASISPVYNVVRFFVAMTGSLYPRHAICYNYRLKRWWLEEYPFPITASTLGRVGEMRAMAGAEHRAVVALDSGNTDALSSYVHTHRGTPTAIRPLALIDSTADFATDDSLLNVPIRIASGRGRDQVRRIVGASATRLDIDRPWTVTPGITTDDDPATYQIGGIRWEWIGGRFTIDDTESGAARDVEIIYKPTSEAAGLDIQLWYNHDADPRNWRMGYTGDGVAIVPGQPHIRVDLTHEEGDVHQRIDGHKEFYAHGDNYVQPGLSGVKGKEPVRIYRLTMAGVGEEG